MGTRIIKPSVEEALDRGLVQADAELAAELAGHLRAVRRRFPAAGIPSPGLRRLNHRFLRKVSNRSPGL
jgi:hypothetical protein